MQSWVKEKETEVCVFFFPQAFKEKCWTDHLRHDSSTNLAEIEKACKYMLNTFFV